MFPNLETDNIDNIETAAEVAEQLEQHSITGYHKTVAWKRPYGSTKHSIIIIDTKFDNYSTSQIQ